jgi:hypothetical protein
LREVVIADADGVVVEVPLTADILRDGADLEWLAGNSLLLASENEMYRLDVGTPVVERSTVREQILYQERRVAASERAVEREQIGRLVNSLGGKEWDAWPH